MDVNGSVRVVNGEHRLFWNGESVLVSKDEAAALALQTMLKMDTLQLEGSPLDWAVAQALNYTPRLQGESVKARMFQGGILPSYEGFYVVAYYNRSHYGEFRPSRDPVQSSPILDAHRISTEIAGDGWAALKNDCFSPATWAHSVKAPTRVEAALRCLVQHVLGNTVDVPVELIAPQLRIKATRDTALALATVDEQLRAYVRTDGPTAYYPVPSEWAGWLLRKYHQLAGAKPAPACRRYLTVPFDHLSDEGKLTMLHREIEGANTSGLPTRTVPASWVVWLLGEHDQLAGADTMAAA